MDYQLVRIALYLVAPSRNNLVFAAEAAGVFWVNVLAGSQA